MSKKIYTPSELEEIRLKKNATLRAWRSAHKEHVSLYMKNWHAAKKLKAVQLPLI